MRHLKVLMMTENRTRLLAKRDNSSSDPNSDKSVNFFHTLCPSSETDALPTINEITKIHENNCTKIGLDHCKSVIVVKNCGYMGFEMCFDVKWKKERYNDIHNDV